MSHNVLLFIQVAEETTRTDPHSLVTLQRHLIDVLRRENGALRLLRLQVDQLKKENGNLKGELKRHQPIVNGLTNGDGANHRTIESLEDELSSLRIENDKLRKAGKGLPTKGKKVSKSNGIISSSKSTSALHNGGLTNGYHTHSSQSEEEEDTNHMRLTITNGHHVNGSSAAGDSADGSTPPPLATVRPALVKGNDVGAGTSGTSLVTGLFSIDWLGKILKYFLF